MANTQISTMLATTAGIALAACGGGSSAVNNNPTLPPSASPTVQTLKSYSDGSGVITGKLRRDDNFSLITSNVETGLRVANGTLDLVIMDSLEEGNFYYVEREGVTNSGDALNTFTLGEILNLSGSEYTSLSFIYVNDQIALMTGGTPMINLPKGSYVYSGISYVDDINGDGGFGTFTMNVDFSSKKADIAASIPANYDDTGNPALFFGANNIAINSKNGSFSSSFVKIGIVGTSGNDASLHGYFAGSTAQGVNGIVYDNGSSTQYEAGFYGSR